MLNKMSVSQDVTTISSIIYKYVKIVTIMKKVRRNLRNILHEKPLQHASKELVLEDFKHTSNETVIPKGSIFNSGDEDGDVLMDLSFKPPSKNQESKDISNDLDYQGKPKKQKRDLCYFQMPLDFDITSIQKFLGLHEQKDRRDVVFLSLSLRTSKSHLETFDDYATTQDGNFERITEFAMSTLDTRDLFKATSRSEPMKRLIKTEYYIVDEFSNGRPQSHGEEQKSVFADAKHITARRAKFTLLKAFKIRDEFGSITDGKARFRDVVFVGCSPQFDRQILVNNCYELWNGGRTTHSVDLLPLTRWLHGNSKYLDKLPLTERFSLDAVLGELLGCEKEVLNTGDKAAYTLLAMLQLAIQSHTKYGMFQGGTIIMDVALMVLVSNELKSRRIREY